ncbi:DUF4331 family protein [Streptomyces sp. NPDC059743]|uniref:DUF4331 family protein n=1 Tax=Streptomyces sp. NPDC059743 TaxID=3346928 RepID=UPI0036577DD3
MSHHLDSPIARQDPRLDLTDFFLFRGERGTVFVMDASHSLAGEDIPRGFHPEGRYEFKIDGDGDAVEELTYRFTFGERGPDGGQSYRLHRLTGVEAQDNHAEGTLVVEGGTDRVQELGGGARVWAGKAGDPFWIEPDVLQAVGKAVKYGTRVDLTGWEPVKAMNLFAGHTVYSIVLEVSDSELLALAGPDRRIGAWALASLATDVGGWRQINRVGHPMIHPLFAQLDEDLGDRLNLGRPADDVRTYGATVAGMIAGAVRAYGTAEDPDAYGRCFAARVLPNLLSYTVGTPACYSFLQWNGRALTDNAPDVMFSTALNTPLGLAIGKDSITTKPSPTYPYVPAAA